MSSRKPITRADYDKMTQKVEKMKYKISKLKKNQPTKQEKNTMNEENNTKLKLDAINSLIGYLVRKGNNTGVEIETLIEIANDYEERMKYS